MPWFLWMPSLYVFIQILLAPPFSAAKLAHQWKLVGSGKIEHASISRKVYWIQALHQARELCAIEPYLFYDLHIFVPQSQHSPNDTVFDPTKCYGYIFVYFPFISEWVYVIWQKYFNKSIEYPVIAVSRLDVLPECGGCEEPFQSIRSELYPPLTKPIKWLLIPNVIFYVQNPWKSGLQELVHIKRR